MKSTAHPRVIDRGLLTSAYKEQIKQTARDMKSQSLSRVKTSLHNYQEKFQSQTASVLQVSVFTLVLVFLLF